MSRLLVVDLAFFSFGPFSLEVGPGECVGVSGPSGAGKSLFLRAIADLDPNEGRVALGELERDAVDAPEWRRRVGLLPAATDWWWSHVGEHFPRDEFDHDLLDLLGLPTDVLDWPVDRLSSGESQRLALARLLARGPDALLLDEPTAHLDGDTRTAVESVVAEFQRARSIPVVWVSHDPNQLARVATRQLRLDDNRLREAS